MVADANLVLQSMVVALAVLVSAWVVMKRQAPQLVRRLRIRLAVPLLRAARPPWLRALGRRIAPPSIQTGACGGCGGCAPPG